MGRTLKTRGRPGLRVIDGGLPAERRPSRQAQHAHSIRPDRPGADVERCRAMQHAHRLAEWVGSGRPLEPGGTLTPEDATAAVRALGLPRLATGRADSSHEHDELASSWATALGADFLRMQGNRVLVGQGMLLWRANAGTTRRDLWLRAFRRRVGFRDRVEPSVLGGGGAWVQGSAAMIALRLLYEAPDGLPVREAVETIGQVLAAIGYTRWEPDGDSGGDPVGGLVLLEDFGVLAMPGDRVALSSLGHYLGDSVLLP